MGNKTIYFISSNEHKIQEAQAIMAEKRSDVQIKSYDSKDIKEIQSKDMKEIVLDKAMKAYKSLQRPLIVEHTGLMIEDFGGLPGGLTQVFWSSFSPPATSNKTDDNMATCKKFCEHFGGKKVTAVSWVAFCDGKEIKTYKGETEGTIPTTPMGESPFQWDPVFVPENCDQSFAQMTEDEQDGENKKNQISMRRKALDKFATDLDQIIQPNPNYLSEVIDQHIQDIKRKIAKDKLILFIGSGVSKPLNLPDWNQLIAQLANDIGYSDPKIFALYGDNLTLAEYYKVIKKAEKSSSDTSTPLTKWMKDNLSLDRSSVEASPIHQELAKLKCSIVYTTNYDEALEKTFEAAKKKYHKIANIKDLANIPKKAVQLIKFHGDMIDEKSIVLAEQDYFNRLNFDTPLDIKLRADMLGKSILFLGYSMSDINIRLLSYKLDQLWKNSPDAAVRPKSYIFMAQPNPIQEEIFRNRGITPIVGEDADRTVSLLQFLKKLNE